MPPFSTTVIKLNSNVVVLIVGFCINQMSTFLLPILNSTLRNFICNNNFFFLNRIFPYKTRYLPQVLKIEWPPPRVLYGSTLFGKKKIKMSIASKIFSKLDYIAGIGNGGY